MSVSNLVEDRQGKIWLTSFFGDIFYLEGDSLKIFEPWMERQEKSFPTINFIKDSLIIANRNQLLIYDLGENTFKNIFEGTSSSSTRGGWIFLNDSLGWMAKNVIYPNEYYKSQKDFIGFHVSKVASRNWYFSQESRKLYLGRSNHTLKDISSAYEKILATTREVREVEKGLIAFLGTDGFYILNLVNNNISHHLKGKNVSAITAIKEGGYMIGTLNDGLFYIPSLHSSLISGQFEEISIYKKEDLIIAGDFNGHITIIDSSLKVVKKIKSPFLREVQSLYVNENNGQLIYYTNKLFQYDVKNELLKVLSEAGATKDILVQNNQYYLATSNGFQVYNNNKLQTFLTGVRCTSLGWGKDKKVLWIGSQLGIFRFNLKNKEAPELFKIKEIPKVFGVTCLVTTKDNLLIGTPLNGLLVVDQQTLELKQRFSTENQLPSNNISVIHKDNNNNNTFWIGTDRGLIQFDMNTGGMKRLDKTKGLVAEEVVDILSTDKKLWVVHDKGIQILDKSYLMNSQSPHLKIDLIQIDEEQLALDTENVVLNPQSGQLKIGFDVSNTIKSLGTTQIFFRLKELNKNSWNKTTLKNPVANYLGLSPGNYTLEAFALNEDGFRSEPLALSISVLAPFYQKNWFLICLTVVICLIIGALIYLQTLSINKKRQTALQLEAREQELQLAQLTSIRSQMNPHFIFNTMSLIQGKVLNGMPEVAGKVIQDFSQLMRKVLEFSQVEMVTVGAEAEVIKRYLAIEKERSQGALEYTVNIAEEIEPDMHKIPSLITQPFVENAIKHGLMHKKGLKKITIEFSAGKEGLEILIKDNGIGRKAAGRLSQVRNPRHLSFALNSYKKRFELFNALREEHVNFTMIDVYDERGKPAGTEVKIKINEKKNERK